MFGLYEWTSYYILNRPVVKHLDLNWQATPAGLPVFKRVAEAIGLLIRQGRLAPGDTLPSSRSLASHLELHRNTILAAYDELIAQGYLEARAGRGTFVSSELKIDGSCPDGPSAPRTRVRLELGPAPTSYHPVHLGFDGIALLGGLADLRLVPATLLARAYRAALRNSKGSTLDYLGLRGHPRFITALGDYLRQTRGVSLVYDEMLVTRGSQQALHLAARSLVGKRRIIAVEKAGYPPAWEAFRLAGATLLPVAIDDDGLVVDELAALCAKHRIAAVYVTPHHQYPTTKMLSAARRLALLRLAEQENFVVVEDDYDHEFHFDKKPVLPLKNLDTRGVVLHVGTLSKVLAPGLRVGYAVGQPALIELMAQNRAYLDRQGDQTLELALAYLIEDGELLAHVRRMHRCYRVRRNSLFEALDAHLEPVFDYTRPAGGMAVWGKLNAPLRATEVVRRAQAQGVLIQAARPFFLDQRERPFLRLGFARAEAAEIEKAIQIIAKIVRGERRSRGRLQ